MQIPTSTWHIMLNQNWTNVDSTLSVTILNLNHFSESADPDAEVKSCTILHPLGTKFSFNIGFNIMTLNQHDSMLFQRDLY